MPEPEVTASSGNGNTPAPEPETDPLKVAMAYRLDSGRVLGKLPDTALKAMLDKINELANPKRKMREIKAHIETLLEYLNAQATKDEESTPVPAEEPGDDGDGDGNDWSSQVVQTLIRKELVTNVHNAQGMLKHSDLTPLDTVETIVEWAEKYRESRDAGGEVDDAAAVANAWLASRESQEELPF